MLELLDGACELKTWLKFKMKMKLKNIPYSFFPPSPGCVKIPTLAIQRNPLN